MSEEPSERQSFSARYLRVDEGRLKLNAVSSHYDVGVFMASWEDRCAAICDQTSITCDTAVIAYFEPSHAPSDEIDQRLDHLAAALTVKGAKKVVRAKLGSSIEYEGSLRLLRKHIEAVLTKGTLQSICIDISSFPIGFIQGLMGWLVVQGLGPSVDCYYVEPDYDTQKLKLAHVDRFTDGDWRLVSVPFLEGSSAARFGKSAIVCLGAESGATRELLLAREYQQVALVRPLPQPPTPWSAQVGIDCEELVTALSVLGGSALQASPYSLCTVATYYAQNVLEPWSSRERMFVALGSKPHGLAGVVCGIIDPGLAVFARVPNAYVPRKVGFGPACWRYRFRDLSSPLWATASSVDWLTA